MNQTARIAPKQFSYLTDLWARGDVAAWDTYANSIGWPWRATQAQLDSWNAWLAEETTR